MIKTYYFYIFLNLNYPDHLYIGSTNNLKMRKSCHKYNCNTPTRRHHNYKIYKTMRECGGWDEWSMICIDSGEMTKQECFKYETELIEMHKPSMNTIRACRKKKHIKLMQNM